jgi:hypothetical protein
MKKTAEELAEKIKEVLIEHLDEGAMIRINVDEATEYLNGSECDGKEYVFSLSYEWEPE